MVQSSNVALPLEQKYEDDSISADHVHFFDLSQIQRRECIQSPSVQYCFIQDTRIIPAIPAEMKENHCHPSPVHIKQEKTCSKLPLIN